VIAVLLLNDHSWREADRQHNMFGSLAFGLTAGRPLASRCLVELVSAVCTRTWFQQVCAILSTVSPIFRTPNGHQQHLPQLCPLTFPASWLIFLS